ncbi:hypothetical protein FPOAC1_000954 [Fusarium poae]|uniref:Uncharacterized protein n=1 Tax=Fusarium poae TaxID=36050 RepID=A0A1B8B2K8_FUSPO|nr:hypothetical protein FPOAC1_000954 [Fusarium poae]KAG8674979.1 hypothetical protein FPOAC1_000954 [Fusarium poae]OBS26972.1 hypothetical protein FPOA_00913 [Fusarium poae]
MASSPSIASADKVSLEEFNRLLLRYPSVIQRISDEKGVKNGQKSLKDLDEYRYSEALDCFDAGKRIRPMTIDDIKTLVEWKLRHGKFRPTLMKLVSSNDPNDAQDVIKQALEIYDEKADTVATVDVLTKLRGIGPATASLLLAVHDASRVIFFADEAFWWLCCSGKQTPIKYNAKEYRMLCSEVDGLRNRLGVKASDIEKVAYVLMKQPGPTEQSHDAAPVKKEKGSTSTTAPTKKRKVNEKETRKTDNAVKQQPSLRRSKRVKS